MDAHQIVRQTPLILEDTFVVLEKDKSGKKFDIVSRYDCHSDLYEMDVVLDINTDLFPLEKGQKFILALAWTLNKDNTAFSNKYDETFPTVSNMPTLMNDYDYVMHGKVFKYKDVQKAGQNLVEIYISFGGLLMQLSGDPDKLESIEVDSNLFLLLKALR